MEWHPLKLKRCRLLMVLSLCGLAASRHCDHRHYWDSKSRVCRPCSRCPMNEIIRKPCGRHTNTVCGPFREFNFFNQLEGLDSSSYTSYEYETFFNENTSGQDKTAGHPGKTGGLANEPIVEKDDGEYWKNLAFALIGVVCVLIFVATIVVLMACRKLHENATIKRPEEEEDDDSGYVVIRAIRPPNMVHRPTLPSSSRFASAPMTGALLTGGQACASTAEAAPLPQRPDLRSKGTYTPTRRLINYDADDVFESEDSGGSRSSRRGAALQPTSEMSTSGGACHVSGAEEMSVWPQTD